MGARHVAWGPAVRRAAGPVRWILSTIVMLLAASLIVFAMQELIPGDPALTILSLQGGQLPNPAQIAAKRTELGLDDPFWTRYSNWLVDVLHGDFGRAWSEPADVRDLIAPRIGRTLELAFLSILFALGITTIVGTLSAMRPSGAIDRVTRVAVVMLIAVPSFVLGLLILQFVVLDLGVGRVLATPTSSAAVLPAVLLATVIAAGWVRPFRALMRDALTGQAVLVARARGLTRAQAARRVALPAALLDFLPFVGLTVGGALGATMLIEVVFSWPGAAAYAVEAAKGRDLPVVQAFTLISVVMFRLATDAVRGVRWVLDPRQRTAHTATS